MTLIALLGALIVGQPTGPILLMPAGFVAICPLLHVLAKRGHLDRAAFALLSAMFACITGVVWMMGTIRAPIAGYYVALVVLAGLTWGRRGVIGSAACASLAYVGLLTAEQRGMLPTADPTLTLTQWVVASSLFACVGWMSYAAHSVIVRALSQTEQEVRERQVAEQALARSNDELRTALASVRTLSGLLPVCAWCKKIRDDDGYWNTIEAYIETRTDASISHGLCTACSEQHFHELTRPVVQG
jgi:hypothetical protein